MCIIYLNNFNSSCVLIYFITLSIKRKQTSSESYINNILIFFWKIVKKKHLLIKFLKNWCRNGVRICLGLLIFKIWKYTGDFSSLENKICVTVDFTGHTSTIWIYLPPNATKRLQKEYICLTEVSLTNSLTHVTLIRLNKGRRGTLMIFAADMYESWINWMNRNIVNYRMKMLA